MIVATGALPAFWLGRRWLGRRPPGRRGAAVYLLYPPLQWATLTEFHPVTLAAPLLMFCIWAAEERRYALLTVLAVLAALTKEEVGLALAVLGVWMVVRGTRAPLRGGRWPPRRSRGSRSRCWWSSPTSTTGEGSAFVDRYARSATTAAAWRAPSSRGRGRPSSSSPSYDRLSYLGALLVPAAFLSLAAPLLAAGALPEVLINVLAGLVPPVLDRVPVRRRDRALPRRRGHPRARPAAPRRAGPRWLGAAARARRGGRRAGSGWCSLSGVYLGPLPWWGARPGVGSDERIEQYRRRRPRRARWRGPSR